jgi:glucose/arabinose dehydrogenase
MRVMVPLILAAALAAPACAQPIVGDPPQRVEERMVPEPPGITVASWVEGLEAPWSLVFLPEGKALVSERPGRIRLIEQGRMRPQPLAVVESVQGGEGGLMGLAAHPRFPAPPFIYAMHTYREGGRTTNRVIRLVVEGTTARFDRVIVAGIPGARNHNGGRIAFGPDGHLYIGTGETFEADLAQDPSSLGGKLLRVTADGGVPPDNPTPTSPVYSLGHRNIQGLAWHSSGTLFISEHGPSGEFGLRAWDEINVIRKGANYAWPKGVGAIGRAEFEDPIVAFRDSSTPPSGAAFWNDTLFVATLRSRALIRIRVEQVGERWQAVAIDRWFAHNRNEGLFGRLRDAVVGPDGALYVLTNNRAGRGRPQPGEDRILRLTQVPVGRTR